METGAQLHFSICVKDLFKIGGTVLFIDRPVVDRFNGKFVVKFLGVSMKFLCTMLETQATFLLRSISQYIHAMRQCRQTEINALLRSREQIKVSHAASLRSLTSE